MKFVLEADFIFSGTELELTLARRAVQPRTRAKRSVRGVYFPAVGSTKTTDLLRLRPIVAVDTASQMIYYAHWSMEIDKQISSYERNLLQNGVLQVDVPNYVAQAAKLIEQKLAEQMKGKKRWDKRLKAIVRAYMEYQESMCRWVEKFQGQVPQSWLDPEKIVESYRNAKTQGIQFSARLVNPGLIHPSVEVRTALWESQHLTGEQMAIVACYGINSADPAEMHRAKGMAILSMPLLDVALNNVFRDK